MHMNRYDFYDKLRQYKENDPNSLSHYGTIGQKWGVRKWQNADGTFNEAGKERYFGKNGTTKKNADEKIGKLSLGFDKNSKAYLINDKWQNEDGSLTKKGQKVFDKLKDNPEKLKKKINMDL